MRKSMFLVSLFLAWLIASSYVAAQTQYLPVDSDDDGVEDSLDECYKTPRGTKVDAVGCPILTFETTKMNLKIEFDVDSSVVKEQYFSELKKVADFMSEHPSANVTLEAHTDSDGSDQYNDALSKRRAASVAHALIGQFNIEPQRVFSIGYGEKQPLVPNTTEENKSRNRRVVAELKSVNITR